MKSRKLSRALVGSLLAVVMVVTAVAVSARYLDTIQDSFAIGVKPYHGVAFQQQSWQQNEDDCTFSFQLAQPASNCRIYLAASAGVVQADSLTVALLLPDETVLQAQAEQITEDSDLYRMFGAGYVFRFRDAQTGEELQMDLSTEAYDLRVSGMDGAATQTSLLRVFVEDR